MDSLMDFIEQNYGWFFGIGLVLIFGFIGFLADKRKNRGEGKSKREKVTDKEDNRDNIIVEVDQVEDNEPVVTEESVANLGNEYENLDADESSPQEESLDEEVTTDNSDSDNIEYAYDNYSQLPAEDSSGETLYTDDDLAELKNYDNTEVVENSDNYESTVEVEETDEGTPHVIDESVVAKQPDTNVEPIEENNNDLDDIWKI